MYLTCCRILDVKPGSDILTIKKAFRRKAKLYHPDLNPLPQAGIEFIKIKKAFDYLNNYSSVTFSSNIVNHSSYNKDFYYRKEKQHNYRKKAREEIDFKTTLFGKSVYYFFHFLFFITGILIATAPIFTLITKDSDPGKSMVVSYVFACVASLFGITMAIMVVFSGLNKKFPFHIIN